MYNRIEIECRSSNPSNFQCYKTSRCINNSDFGIRKRYARIDLPHDEKLYGHVWSYRITKVKGVEMDFDMMSAIVNKIKKLAKSHRE